MSNYGKFEPTFEWEFYRVPGWEEQSLLDPYDEDSFNELDPKRLDSLSPRLARYTQSILRLDNGKLEFSSQWLTLRPCRSDALTDLHDWSGVGRNVLLSLIKFLRPLR